MSISLILTDTVNQRQNATRIIIYLSDEGVHSAMDGLSAKSLIKNGVGMGIIAPAGNKPYIWLHSICL